jgi:hypothetical protein
MSGRYQEEIGLIKLTASSTAPNSSNLVRRAFSSVCHARPLGGILASALLLRRIYRKTAEENLPDEELGHLDDVVEVTWQKVSISERFPHSKDRRIVAVLDNMGTDRARNRVKKRKIHRGRTGQASAEADDGRKGRDDMTGWSEVKVMESRRMESQRMQARNKTNFLKKDCCWVEA